MELITLSHGMFDSNCYILAGKKQCAIIDCGVSSQKVMSILTQKGLEVKYIILTHGHLDHIHNVAAIQEATKGELCIHEDELELYKDPNKNGYSMFGYNSVEIAKPDRLLKNGDKLLLEDLMFEIIHTPGHSPGSISILCGDFLFTGDTLFSQGVGRTDLYGGSGKKLVDSIKNQIYTLDGDIKVYPGHGPSTTIAFERENNPYV